MILKYRGKCGTLLIVTWQPGWEGSLGEEGYVCMYDESLHCSLAAITTLLIGYTPVLNKKGKKSIQKKIKYMEKCVCYVQIL